MNITVTLTANPDFLDVLKSFTKAFTPQLHTPEQKAFENNTSKAEPAPPTQPASAAPVEIVAEPSSAVAVSIEQIRTAVQAKSQAGKREEIKQLLSHFGADKVTNLSKDQYTAFLQEVTAL